MNIQPLEDDRSASRATPELLGTPQDCPASHLEPQLAQLVHAIGLPENQGESLTRMDYILVLLTSTALPVLMILIGRLS
jgi:hypothetical protein